jgi:hypothetical protein
MTIDEAKKFIEGQARLNQIGNISPAQLNIYFKRAQLEIVDELRALFEASSIISDELSPLVSTTDITQITSGVANKPTDFRFVIPPLEADYYVNATDTDPAYQNYVPVYFITHNEKALRLNSQIDYPTREVPIAINYNGYFQIYPDTVQKIRLTYIKTPTDPIWAYTTTNSSPVYDSLNSVQFTLPEPTHLRICWKVLGYFGISLRDADLVQNTEIKTKG